MHANNTAQALVQVRGPTVTYSVLKFYPNVSSRAHSLEINGFTIRRGNDRFSLEDLPVSHVLTNIARDDILFHTFEADEDERSAYVEVDFEIPEYDEQVRVHFRVAEREEWPDMLFYEVEDSSGDWLAVEDVNFIELLTDTFLHTLEISVIDQLNSHTLDMLPLATDY